MLGQFEEGALAVVAAATGIGELLTGRGLAELFSLFPADLVIGMGIAGGLERSLPSGTLYLLEEVGRYDWPSLHSGDWLSLPLSSPFGECLRRLPALTTARGLCHGHHILHRAAEKVALGQQAAAAVVDMESWFWAHACQQRQTPFFAIRAISDEAGEELPDLNLFFDPQRGFEMARLAAHLAFRPRQMWRLREGGRRGAKNLAALWPALLAILRQEAARPRENRDCGGAPAPPSPGSSR